MLDTIFSWGTMWWVLLIIYIPACLGLILIVLLQQGKGTGFAGAFGAGPGGDAIFGKSAQSLPVKITYVAAAIFMVIAVILSVISGKVGKGASPELANEASISGLEGGASSSMFDERGGGSAVVNPDIEEDIPEVILEGTEEEGSGEETPVEDSEPETVDAESTESDVEEQ
jgi:preprotein translocase subunit SecG